mmetsp:Transcript_4362/g.12289  ORF Transcript_4362/g.12289 Transcript_4362/m.12289 type:complete len:378 (-) Transcript_4362:368-1501(-)
MRCATYARQRPWPPRFGGAVSLEPSRRAHLSGLRGLALRSVGAFVAAPPAGACPARAAPPDAVLQAHHDSRPVLHQLLGDHLRDGPVQVDRGRVHNPGRRAILRGLQQPAVEVAGGTDVPPRLDGGGRRVVDRARRHDHPAADLAVRPEDAEAPARDGEDAVELRVDHLGLLVQPLEQLVVLHLRVQVAGQLGVEDHLQEVRRGRVDQGVAPDEGHGHPRDLLLEELDAVLGVELRPLARGLARRRQHLLQRLLRQRGERVRGPDCLVGRGRIFGRPLRGRRRLRAPRDGCLEEAPQLVDAQRHPHAYVVVELVSYTPMQVKLGKMCHTRMAAPIHRLRQPATAACFSAHHVVAEGALGVCDGGGREDVGPVAQNEV